MSAEMVDARFPARHLARTDHLADQCRRNRGPPNTADRLLSRLVREVACLGDLLMCLIGPPGQIKRARVANVMSPGAIKGLNRCRDIRRGEPIIAVLPFCIDAWKAALS